MALPFYMVLNRTFHAQQTVLRTRMKELDLSPGQPKILHYLLEHGLCSQKELADYCDIEPATVSRLLDNMEATGLVARNPDPTSRRKTQVSITQPGRHIFRKWQDICLAVEAEETAGIPPEQLQLLDELLRTLYQNLSGKPLE